MTETPVFNPPTVRGDKVMVHRYYGYATELTFPVERTASGPADDQGDLPLEPLPGQNTHYAGKWAKAAAKVTDEGWNPDVPIGATVWVFRDSSMNPDMVNPRGFDLRVVTNGTKDSDGEISLAPSVANNGMLALGTYARRWCLPAENLRPAVKKGDRIKVLGCLSGATEEYQRHVMGKVLEVTRDTRHEGDDHVIVNLPDGYMVDGFPTGTAAQWAIISRFDPDAEEIPVVRETEETTNWEEVIRQWRGALHEFACDHEWCSEYEETVMRLFGWVETRGADFDVTVRLTKEKWLSDLTNNLCYQVFDGERDEDNWNLDDERIDIRASITVAISCKSNQGPTDEEVREYLDENDYEYDDFDIVDHEIITD